MASTTILLREDIESLGGRGEIVKVRAGYARNYLLPQGLATLATKGNLRQIEGERTALLKKAAIEKATAEAQKEQMGAIALDFERKAGEGGTLFGSVTSIDITAALQAKGYEIDRKKISLRDPIKETGEYTIKVRLHREVSIEIPVTVTAEGGEAVEAKPAKKSRKAKADEAEAEETIAAEPAEEQVEE
ncbi:MAG: 50S ribosomal protein L9 [Acidobacteria bacterium]|nr:50S ribosomal protein L9 [Acidobacteriota bacterium]